MKKSKEAEDSAFAICYNKESETDNIVTSTADKIIDVLRESGATVEASRLILNYTSRMVEAVAAEKKL